MLKETEKLKNTLKIPSVIEGNVLEGFEPLLVTSELIDVHFMHLVNHALTYVPDSSNDQ